MRCCDLYVAGCERLISGPSWYHPEHFESDGGRPSYPDLCNVPERVIRTVADSSERAVRVAVIRHPGTPADLVDRLAEDRDEGVRAEALVRTRSVELLRRGGADGSWAIRGAVALNPRCPADVLERLSRDVDSTVRARVMANRSCPAHILEAGLSDPHEHVRWWAMFGRRS